GEGGHLLAVGLPLGQGGGEDRRVGGHAQDATLDVALQVAVGDHRPVEVVQPDRDTGLGQLVQRGAGGRAVGGGALGRGLGRLAVVHLDLSLAHCCVSSVDRVPPSPASPRVLCSPSGSSGTPCPGAGSPWAAASDSRAAATTASAVMPNSW